MADEAAAEQIETSPAADNAVAPAAPEAEPAAAASVTSVATESPVAPSSAAVFQPPDLAEQPSARPLADIELLNDVELNIKVELGRTEMYIEDVLKLGVGSVVELDKLAGDPVDIYVNERLVARGEVLVLNDNFCVRVNDIVSPIPELETAK